MQPTGRLYNAAHLAGLETKCSVLKLLLHIPLAEVAKVAPLACRRAVGFGEGELAQGYGAGLDLGLVGLDDLESVVLGAGDFGLRVWSAPHVATCSTRCKYLFPAAWPAAVAVLDQQVGGADLVIRDAGNGAGAGAGAVVGGHVVLELLGVRARRRLPSRDFVGGVEVVGEVLGVGVADFPVGGQAGVSLGVLERR